MMNILHNLTNFCCKYSENAIIYNHIIINLTLLCLGLSNCF